MGWGKKKKSSFWHTKALISLKHGKIGPRLLLKFNRKSHMCFRLVPKSTVSDDLKARFKVSDAINAIKLTKYVSDVEIT